MGVIRTWQHVAFVRLVFQLKRVESCNPIKIRSKAGLQDRHNYLLSKQEIKVVMLNSATLNKNSSAAAAPAATTNLADEISLMRKLKAHLAKCQCCKDALNSPEEINGAGIQPAPSSKATTDPTAQVRNAIT
jgi:hypothetical protein